MIEAIEQQRNRLAAIGLRASLDPRDAASTRDAIAAAFVTGFRAIMLISAALALASAASAWVLVEGASPLGSGGQKTGDR